MEQEAAALHYVVFTIYEQHIYVQEGLFIGLYKEKGLICPRDVCNT